MKAMPSVTGWRQRQKKKSKPIVVINNETNWPVHRPVAAVLLQIWIIESYERINPHMVGGVAPDMDMLTSCSERIDSYTVPWQRCCSTSGIFRTKWHVNSPVAASGAVPDLEDTVLLHRCWSRADICWIFAVIHESQVIQSQAHFW